MANLLHVLAVFCKQFSIISFLRIPVQEKTLRTQGIYVIFLTYQWREVFMRRYAAMMACIMMSAALSAQAEFYRWVDSEGKEFFSNQSNRVPSEYRGSMMKVIPDKSRVRVEERKPVPMRSMKQPTNSRTDMATKKSAGARKGQIYD